MKKHATVWVISVIFCFALGGISTCIYAQDTTVSGKVVDANTNDPLPGVNVTIFGTTRGTATGLDGNYELNVSSLSDTLVFSFIGYETQTIPIEGRDRIDVRMSVATGILDEVLVVGYADMSKRRTTSSISYIDETELRNIPSVNPVQALQGKMAGVSIPVLSGQPGAGANIVIRGGTTLRPYGEIASGRDVGRRDPSDPLVIVDGVFRSLDDINPDDIESIQVMKDAASTAIYGARGANGVIVVKTKSGRGVGEPNFTFRYERGVDIPARQYDYLNAREYLNLARRTVANCENNSDACDSSWLFNGPGSQSIYLYSEPGQYGRSTFYTASLENLIEVEGQAYVDDLLARGWETMDDPVSDHTIIFKDSEYQDVVWQNAASNEFDFGVKGSTDDIHYNLSLGYNDQGGTFIGTGYQRFSALANTGYRVNDKVNLTLNLSYLWNDDKYSDNTIRDLTRGVRVPPLTRQYYDDGTPALGEGNNPRNRLHQLYYQDFNRNTNQFIVRLAADYQIAANLQFRPSVSLNTNNFSRRDFEAFYPEQPQSRDKYQRVDENRQIMIDNVLQYTNTFGSNHNVMGLIGFNYTSNTLYRLIGQSQRSATDYISTITGDPQTSIIGGELVANMHASSLYQEELSASYFGQFSYDYDLRYLFGASLRYDGFSNFAPENRYALFPSISVGWNISNEDFWNVNFINHLKLRSSWGEAGLSNLSINDTFGVYGSSTYASAPGVTRSNLANPSLKWETTETLDAGFDMSLFNDRLSVVFDVYNIYMASNVNRQ